jgi:hypothetical protein
VKDTAPNLGELLLGLALEKAGPNLDARVAAGQTRDIGIFRHEGTNYCYDLQWTKEGRELDFLLEIIAVHPGRKDRKPKTELVASRQFTHKE